MRFVYIGVSIHLVVGIKYPRTFNVLKLVSLRVYDLPSRVMVIALS